MLVRTYTRSDQGLPPVTKLFGDLGPVRRVTLHHTAGPRANTKARAIELHKQYDAQHRRQGWGGIGYHIGIDSLGRIYRLRWAGWKGAHTGGDNSNNFGVMVHGNYMTDQLNYLQKRTLKALYRGDVEGFEFLGDVPWYGHQERPGHASNACPGTSQVRYLKWLRSRPR